MKDSRKPVSIKRDPMARALALGQYQPKRVKPKTAYTRKAKHTKPLNVKD